MHEIKGNIRKDIVMERAKWQPLTSSYFLDFFQKRVVKEIGIPLAKESYGKEKNKPQNRR